MILSPGVPGPDVPILQDGPGAPIGGDQRKTAELENDMDNIDLTANDDGGRLSKGKGRPRMPNNWRYG